MLGGFLSAANQTIVASALPTIGRELNDFQNLSWVIIAYLLSSTIVAPLYGKLADIHGRRGMMLVAVGLFVVGSALCGMAQDMATLLVGRTLQGIGGGGIVPMMQITVADMVTPRERAHYQAYMGAAWVAAGVAGPALGGIIADFWHWSMIFWLNVPLGLLTAVLLNHSMKKLPPAGPQAQARLPRRGAGDGGSDAASARAHHRRHPCAVDVADHRDACWWFDPAHGGRDLVAQARAGAVPAAEASGQPGAAARHRGDKLRHGRADRLHDLHAALFPDRAQAHADAGGPGAHSGRRADHAGLDAVRPRHDASRPLQALALCRARVGDARGRVAGDMAGHAGDLGGARHQRGRLRHRHHLPDRHRLRAERGVAARGRHRHRRA